MSSSSGCCLTIPVLPARIYTLAFCADAYDETQKEMTTVKRKRTALFLKSTLVFFMLFIQQETEDFVNSSQPRIMPQQTF
jgi:hypothetical protein